MIDVPPLAKIWTPPKPAIMRASRLPDPVDLRRGVFAPGFMGKPKTKPVIALRNSTTSSSTTVNKPSGCVAGDVLVIGNVGYTSTSSTIPTAVTPAGFTILANTGGNTASLAIRLMLSWRLVDGSEASTFTGMNSGAEYLICLCFSGGVATVTPSVAQTEVASGTPATQTISTASAPMPSIALAFSGGSVSTQTGSMSPTADATTTSGRAVLMYKIFNASPVDVSAQNTTASGSLSGLQSGYLSAA